MAGIYEQKTGETVNPDLFNYTNNKLIEAIDKGTKLLEGNVPNLAFINELKNNVGVFSAFKVHEQGKAMAALLFDKDGNKIPFGKWKKEALKISDHQNKVWLKTEYETAVKRARIGAQFKEFEEDKDLYPNLEWTPSRAETPDAIHQKFWGMILPVDDAFWQNNTPGDRWGCLCGIKQTKSAVKRIDYDQPEPTKGLKGNPAKTGEVISNDHTVFENTTKADKKQIAKEHEELKVNVPYGAVNYTAKNKSTINAHPNCEPDLIRLEENYSAAVVMVDKIEHLEIKLPPHVEINNRKNPDYLLNEATGDLKSWRGKNATSLIKAAIDQDCEIIVIRLFEDSFYQSSQTAFNKVKGQLLLRKKHPIKQLIIIDPQDEVKIFDIKKED